MVPAWRRGASSGRPQAGSGVPVIMWFHHLLQCPSVGDRAVPTLDCDTFGEDALNRTAAEVTQDVSTQKTAGSSSTSSSRRAGGVDHPGQALRGSFWTGFCSVPRILKLETR